MKAKKLTLTYLITYLAIGGIGFTLFSPAGAGTLSVQRRLRRHHATHCGYVYVRPWVFCFLRSYAMRIGTITAPPFM